MLSSNAVEPVDALSSVCQFIYHILKFLFHVGATESISGSNRRAFLAMETNLFVYFDINCRFHYLFVESLVFFFAPF